jgi:hypothetical protein
MAEGGRITAKANVRAFFRSDRSAITLGRGCDRGADRQRRGQAQPLAASIPDVAVEALRSD